MGNRWDTSNRRDTLPKGWDNLRARILTRDGHACTICGHVANQVDHIVRGAGDHPDNLTSLCDTHHAAKSALEGHDAMRAIRARTHRTPPRHPGLA
jgi:5-methylcytosine-specific restriction protein A